MEMKEAIQNATKALKEAFDSESLHDLRLEEIELDENDGAWYVTLGFDRSVDLSPVVTNPLMRQWRRVYKTVKINATTGEPESIKIRETVE